VIFNCRIGDKQLDIPTGSMLGKTGMLKPIIMQKTIVVRAKVAMQKGKIIWILMKPVI
jgi:hypothetical protein